MIFIDDKRTNHAVLLALGRAQPTVLHQVGVDNGIEKLDVDGVVHVCISTVGSVSHSRACSWLGTYPRL